MRSWAIRDDEFDVTTGYHAIEFLLPRACVIGS
jgi:uncharacterized iron-regulated protein